MEASAGYKQNWPIEIWGTFHITQTQLMFLFELKQSYSHQKTSQMHFKYDINATVKKGCTLASTGMFMGIFRMYLTVWQQLLGLNLSLQLSDRCRQIKWQFRMEMQLIIRPSCPWLFPRTAAVSRPVRAGVDETELANLVQHSTKANFRQ